MTLGNMTEEQLADFFGKAFREVVLPELEKMDKKMATKEDLLELELRLKEELASKEYVNRVSAPLN